MVEIQKMNFAGTDFVVMDKFEYKGITYLCLYEDITKKTDLRNLSNLKEDVNMLVEFVYEVENGMYENIVDEEKYNELCAVETKRQENGENTAFLYYQSQLMNNKKVNGGN